jgi:hypothetical protein
VRGAFLTEVENKNAQNEKGQNEEERETKGKLIEKMYISKYVCT